MSSVEADRAVGLAVERCDLEFHYSLLPSAGSRAAGALNEPGNCTPSCVPILDRVADHDPAALGARNRALDHDQAALDIGPDDLDVLRGDAHGRPYGRPSSCP